MRRFISAVYAVLFCVASIAPAFADRQVAYPNQNPTAEQFNGQARFTRIAMGTWIRDALGPNVSAGGVYTNLSISPNGGMNIAVGPTTANTRGALYQLAAVDPNPVPQGSYTPQLSADSTKIIVQALQTGPSGSIGPLSAPTSGLSQYYLVEGQVQTTDTTPIAMTFLDTNANKSQLTLNSVRADQIVYQIKAGIASSTPSIPTVDSGWIAIGTVLVPGGSSSITTGMISQSTTPAFGGFIANGANVTLSGLTISSLTTPGCLQNTSSGAIQSDPCTSGLGSVNATAPLTGTTSGGVATISCPTCMTGVTATSPVTASTSANLLSISCPNCANKTTANSFNGGNMTLAPAGTATASQNYGSIGGWQLQNSFWNGSAAATNTWSIQTGNTNGNLDFYYNGVKAGYLTSAGSWNPSQPITIANGGTGSTTQNFVDLSTTQTVGGSKSFSKSISLGQDSSKNNLFFGNGSGTNYSQFGAYGSSIIVAGVGCAEWGEFGVTASAFHLCMDGSGDLGIGSGLFTGGTITAGPAAGNWTYYWNSFCGASGAAQQAAMGTSNSTGANVQGVTPNVVEFACPGRATFLTIDYNGNMGVSGNVYATNFIQGSRREWKKNITQYGFDPLDLVSNHIDYAEYDCKTDRCGPLGLHKVGIIANDSAVQVAGKNHDHFDAFAMAAIDGAAIKELAHRVDGLELMVKRLCELKQNRKLGICKVYARSHH